MRAKSTRRRRSTAAWTGLLLAGAVTAIPAGSASAAATLGPRPTPAAAATDRVVEQVSPAEKHGQSADAVLQVADGGSGVLFRSLGAFADVQNSTGIAFYRARRGTYGWNTVGMQPRLIGRAPLNTEAPDFGGADPQLDNLIETTTYPFDPAAPDQEPPVRGGKQPVSKVYRVGAGGAVSWLSPDTLAPDGTLGHTRLVAASADVQRLLLSGVDLSGATARLYVRDGDRTVPVDVDPDGNVFGGGVIPVRQGMSDDGQTVVFAANEDGSRSRELYVRRNALRPDADTVVANRSRRDGDPPGTVCDGGFLGLAPDGRRALFSCEQPMTDGAPDGEAGLYEYDPVLDSLRYLYPSGPVDDVLGADRDLRRIYVAGPSEVGVDRSIWLIDDRGAREVVRNAIPAGDLRASVARDGKRVAFLSDKGLDDGYAGRQMYVYDATDEPDGSLTCVSCRPGASSGGEAEFSAGEFGFLDARSGPGSSSFTDDGSFFFMSTAALAPGAPEGPKSVYEYRDGQVRLLAAGTEKDDARFAGASPDGTDVFVVTAQSLVPQDQDYPVLDLYSFRRGGGFPPEPGCSDCEPPAPPDRGGPTPQAAVGSQQDAPLSVGERSPAFAPTPKPRVVSRRATTMAIALRVRVRVAGTIRITGNGLRRTSRKASRAGTYAVTVRLTTKARRAVARRGRLAVRMRVRLTPKAGATSSAATTLTIKRTTRKAA
ncbi:hypothetical protein [Patulibacter defluvii]|uniref:hypothetical protein n=1 Tax=Patulibacter defluvii TaxID=3095358 RepID=UPI002A756F84|nr:hypothetical protein [Patulibacter sp. DM4]